jgi:hypothetical protein
MMPLSILRCPAISLTFKNSCYINPKARRLANPDAIGNKLEVGHNPLFAVSTVLLDVAILIPAWDQPALKL